jgi:biotin-(acetyl-CoA carboxylase) ligase
MTYYSKKKKICGILQETVINSGKKFLIVGIGINTNLDPRNSHFSSTSLKQITNKNIDNKKLFIMIKKNYEKFLFKANQNSFSELKKFTKKI